MSTARETRDDMTDNKLSTQEEREKAADEALKDQGAMDDIMELLGGTNRLKRQKAASTVAIISNKDAKALLPYAEEVAEALSRPEAQTRWEVLEAFTSMIAVDPEAASKVQEAAEDALYDDESGMLRYTAFRYFAKLAATSRERAARIWPLLDEALKCFHGDPEFAGMLDAVVDLLQTGDVDAATRSAIAKSMSFDAQSGSKSPLASRARHIIELCSQK